MKSYKNLYDICISKINRQQGINAIKKSKRILNIIKEQNLSDEELLDRSYEWITDFHYANHSPILIKDGMTGKDRAIIVPTLEELTVQHCIVNALKPMFYQGLYEHSYASTPGRGVHKGKKALQKWILNNKRGTKYVLKMDIRHFFDSIPHNILKLKLAKSIHDELMLHLLYEIIDTIPKGLPLGFYTSQWLSGWYLKPLDHFIKEELHADYYIRYMDDMVILGSNKKKLHRIRKEISSYLNRELGLTLKDNWQVFLFDWNGVGRDIDFMGFRFYRNRICLRRTIMYKSSRKAKAISKKKKISIYDARQILSYFGWIKCTNSYNFYTQYIKPYVCFQNVKRYISKWDKNSDSYIYFYLIKLYS